MRTEGEVIPRAVEVPVIEERIARVLLDNVIGRHTGRQRKK